MPEIDWTTKDHTR